MKYTPAEYINAGFSFEKEKTSAETLGNMIRSEHLDFKIEARRLIEQGRTEARLSETQNR